MEASNVKRPALLLAAPLALAPLVDAKGTRSRGYDAYGRPHAVQGVKRDRHGRIARSSTARRDFTRSHPCPSTGRSSGACSGFVGTHPPVAPWP